MNRASSRSSTKRTSPTSKRGYTPQGPDTGADDEDTLQFEEERGGDDSTGSARRPFIPASSSSPSTLFTGRFDGPAWRDPMFFWVVVIRVVCAMFIVALLGGFRLSMCAASDRTPQECAVSTLSWLHEGSTLYFYGGLACFALFIFWTCKGDVHFLGDWAPGAVMLVVAALLTIRYHGESFKQTAGWAAVAVGVYVAIGVGYSIGGLWWEVRRRGVMDNLVGKAGGRDARNIVNLLESDIIRMMMYWPCFLVRQIVLAVLKDFFTWCYDMFINVYVGIVTRALETMRG